MKKLTMTFFNVLPVPFTDKVHDFTSKNRNRISKLF